jgi:hypothetical protein
MAPILCLIRETEMLFTKRLTSKERDLEPYRYQRILRRFLKRIKPGERIMFIGMTAQPYRARIKSLVSIYQRIILFPTPNYGSRRSK